MRSVRTTMRIGIRFDRKSGDRHAQTKTAFGSLLKQRPTENKVRTARQLPPLGYQRGRARKTIADGNLNGGRTATCRFRLAGFLHQLLRALAS